MIVILWNIRSVYNVASIFRTADAVGIGKIYPHTKREELKFIREAAAARSNVGVYLVGTTPAPIDRFGDYRADFKKVALGAERNIKWKHVSSARAPKLLSSLKKDGYHIFAIEQNKKSVPYYKIHGMRIDSQIRIALILGNEVRGLPSKVLKIADKILEIPMHGSKESLNVSVAFGVVSYGLKYRK